MTTFGPPIPHVPGKPCPFPDVPGEVFFCGRWFQAFKLGGYDWGDCDDGQNITAYRLPADHHAYGPRVSRMAREPDETVRLDPCGAARMRVHVYLTCTHLAATNAFTGCGKLVSTCPDCGRSKVRS